jgi:hypothetical protein
MVTVDFEPQALVLRFTGIETLPPGMSPDDFFRLTSQGLRNHCSPISVSAQRTVIA